MAPPAGALVATVGDLNAAVEQITDKIDEQRRWTSSELDLLRQKITDASEKIDAAVQSVTTALEAHTTDIDALKKTRVNITDFKQQITNLDMKAETTHGALEAMIKKVREDTTRDVQIATQNMTAKSDANESSFAALRDQIHVFETEVLPDVKKQLEDERTKRRAEDLRLERQDEALRDQFERRLEEVMAIMRKDIDNSTEKLSGQAGQQETIDAMMRELSAMKAQFGGQITNLDDMCEKLKEALKNHRESTAASFEKSGKDITTLMNDSSTLQGNVQQLTRNCTIDFKKINESLKEKVQQVQKDLADSRAAAAQSDVGLEKQIQAIVQDVGPLKEAKKLLFDTLKIKDVGTIVREWQAGFVPTTTVAITDLEARVQRLRQDLQAEHDLTTELQRATGAIKKHFRMFETIAHGLDRDGDGIPDYDQKLRPGGQSPTPQGLPPIK